MTEPFPFPPPREPVRPRPPTPPRNGGIPKRGLSDLQADAIQATWQHSKDSSLVWGRRQFGSTDINYVSPDAIEWLLLEVTGGVAGPTGGDKMLAADYIQRVNTVGGKEPALACTAANLNQRQLVPYEADYVFYRPGNPHGGNR